MNAGLTITPEAVSEVREGDPNRLRKRLQGDLDSILLTALRKEPARRYSSVEAFSGDLLRHLDNLPVSAREDTFWYRANVSTNGATSNSPSPSPQDAPILTRIERKRAGCA
jgi:serine/threonine protein kinase